MPDGVSQLEQTICELAGPRVWAHGIEPGKFSGLQEGTTFILTQPLRCHPSSTPAKFAVSASSRIRPAPSTQGSRVLKALVILGANLVVQSFPNMGRHRKKCFDDQRVKLPP